MSRGRRSSLAVRACAFAGGGVLVFALAGCGTYVPDGSMVVSVKNSRHEFDRADLRSNNALARSAVIPMKWYDTNTFMTSSTLNSGSYTFRARNYNGAAISREIVVVPDQELYEIDMTVDNAAVAASAAGPVVSGRIQGAGGKRPTSVSVLFIGKQISMETAEVKSDGSFSASAPDRGAWKIEVHLLGDKPQSYVHPVMDVTGPVDLGVVALK